MPKFTMMPVDEAFHEAEVLSMPDDLAPYADLILNLVPGEIGRLVAPRNENVRMVRLRLSAAARRMNKKIIIRRVGDTLLYWENTQRQN